MTSEQMNSADDCAVCGFPVDEQDEDGAVTLLGLPPDFSQERAIEALLRAVANPPPVGWEQDAAVLVALLFLGEDKLSGVDRPDAAVLGDALRALGGYSAAVHSACMRN